MDRVVVFTGAGISAPLGLPTTVEFLSDIRQGQLPVTESVCNYLASAKSSRGEDIEWILSELERFSTGAGFIEANLVKLAVGNPNAAAGVGHMTSTISDWRNQARREISRIKKILFRRLQSFDVGKAFDLYLNIIKQLQKRHAGGSISVITTNYDLTFDTFIDELDPAELGIAGFNTSFVGNAYDPRENFSWETDVIEYLKVHGSLDWHCGRKGCRKSGVATTPENPDEMHILYPGFKDIPSAEPFISIGGKLNRRLNSATHVYVVGFAFRDAHINTMFENALSLRKDLNVLQINPSSLKNYPVESAVSRFDSAFDNFQIIQKKVEVGVDPLPLDAAMAA